MTMMMNKVLGEYSFKARRQINRGYRLQGYSNLYAILYLKIKYKL